MKKTLISSEMSYLSSNIEAELLKKRILGIEKIIQIKVKKLKFYN